MTRSRNYGAGALPTRLTSSRRPSEFPERASPGRWRKRYSTARRRHSRHSSTVPGTRKPCDPLSTNALFITFQSRDDSVMFSGDGIIEVYDWENSNPTRYGLYIASSNQSVRNLRRLMDIELASTDSVNVRVFQDYRIKADISGRWDGRYRKTWNRDGQVLQAAACHGGGRESGTYPDASRQTMGQASYLTGTPMSTERADAVEIGTWAVFVLDGSTILDMRQLPGETKEYAQAFVGGGKNIETRRRRNKRRNPQPDGSPGGHPRH